MANYCGAKWDERTLCTRPPAHELPHVAWAPLVHEWIIWPTFIHNALNVVTGAPSD